MDLVVGCMGASRYSINLREPSGNWSLMHFIVERKIVVLEGYEPWQATV